MSILSSLDKVIYSALAFAGGSALATEVGINIKLGAALSDGVRAAMVCCSFNFVGILPFAILISPSQPHHCDESNIQLEVQYAI